MDKLEFSDAVNFGLGPNHVNLQDKFTGSDLSLSLLVLFICFLKLLVDMKRSSPKSSVCVQLIQMSWSDYSSRSSNMDTFTAKTAEARILLLLCLTIDIAYEHDSSRIQFTYH